MPETDQWCPAVLRPEGIACTLLKGHVRYRCKDGTVVDHCNVARYWNSVNVTRPGIKEWGFNNPLGRRLDDTVAAHEPAGRHVGERGYVKGPTSRVWRGTVIQVKPLLVETEERGIVRCDSFWDTFSFTPEQKQT